MTTRESDSVMQGNRQYATFFVDGLFFGIDVLEVQEVLRYQEMTNVPLAPNVIEGLINLRGQIVTAVDMRRRLKLKPRAEGTTPMNTVVRSEDGAAVSLLVDEIGDVVEVDAGDFELPPDNVNPAAVDSRYGKDDRFRRGTGLQDSLRPSVAWRTKGTREIVNVKQIRQW
jgi:purine-binding chemotaxis protein CheW